MTGLSRSVESCPLGKCTAEIPKVKVPEETLEGAMRLAREAGMSLSEWLRMLVMVRVHGVEDVRRIYEERILVVAGKGKE